MFRSARHFLVGCLLVIPSAARQQLLFSTANSWWSVMSLTLHSSLVPKTFGLAPFSEGHISDSLAKGGGGGKKEPHSHLCARVSVVRLFPLLPPSKHRCKDRTGDWRMGADPGGTPFGLHDLVSQPRSVPAEGQLRGRGKRCV